MQSPGRPTASRPGRPETATIQFVPLGVFIDSGIGTNGTLPLLLLDQVFHGDLFACRCSAISLFRYCDKQPTQGRQTGLVLEHEWQLTGMISSTYLSPIGKSYRVVEKLTAAATAMHLPILGTVGARCCYFVLCSSSVEDTPQWWGGGGGKVSLFLGSLDIVSRRRRRRRLVVGGG